MNAFRVCCKSHLSQTYVSNDLYEHIMLHARAQIMQVRPTFVVDGDIVNA